MGMIKIEKWFPEMETMLKKTPGTQLLRTGSLASKKQILPKL